MKMSLLSQRALSYEEVERIRADTAYINSPEFTQQTISGIIHYAERRQS